jgi:hypothetical protein
MEATELRITNWILDENGNPVQIVEITDFNRVAVGSDRKVLDLQNSSPIPLTKEILLKAGFLDNNPWEKGNLRLDSENRLIFVDETGYGIIIARNVEFLHRLQNLYFDLIGNELEVKL